MDNLKILSINLRSQDYGEINTYFYPEYSFLREFLKNFFRPGN